MSVGAINPIRCLPVIGASLEFTYQGLIDMGRPDLIHWAPLDQGHDWPGVLVLPVHCGGMYSFGDDDWLTKRLDPILSPEWLPLIRQGKVILTLDGSGEGLAPYETYLRRLHGFLSAREIPATSVIYLCASTDGQQLFDNACRRFGLPLFMQVQRFHSQIYGVIGRITKGETLAQANAFVSMMRRTASEPRERLFLSLNYMPRWWRFAFVLKLMAEGRLDLGLVSFFGQHVGKVWLEGGWENIDWVRADLASKGVPDVHLDHLSELYARTPLTVDRDATADRFNLAYDAPDATLYQRCYASVVSESDMSAEGGTRFTEKALKPLAFGHPIMTLGTPRLLSALEDLGFIVRDGMFDQSYDEIDSTEDRFAAAMNSVDAFLAMGRDEIARRYVANLDAYVANFWHARIGCAQGAHLHPGIRELRALTRMERD
jgi:hypothetical protein